MKKFLFIILIFFSLETQAQNLVPNLSFEIITHCPDDNGAIIYAPPWYNPIINNLRTITPDLFNICSQSNLFGVPTNLFGFQNPRTGSGYSGIGLYSLPIFPDSIEREYISIKLLASLDSGVTYGVHFYLNMANYSTYAINRIGLYISKDSVFGNKITPLLYNPQIQCDTNIVFCDSTKWVPVSGVFFAKGGEKYITIGNFYIDSILKISFIGRNPDFHTAYYYIDDVAVYEITDPIFVAEAGENKRICFGDSSVIGSPVHANYRYKWKPATGLNCDTIAQPTAKPLVTTTYHLTQYDYTDLETYDSITITIRNCDTLSHENILHIYPNPNSGELYVEFSRYVPADATVSLTNTLGQVLLKEAIATEEKKKLVNTSVLAAGVYFCKIYAGDNLLKTEKIIKIP